MNQSPAPLLKTADLQINTNTQQVYKNKQLIQLPDLSFQTLLVLIKASPNAVGSDDLIDQVWQDIEVSPETLTQRIALLRKALGGENSTQDTYIKSVRSKGYRWVPVVHEKVRSKLTINMWLLLTIGLVLFLAVIVMNHLSKTVEQTPTNINSQVSANEYSQRGWRYLTKHDAKNNRLATEMFEKSLQIESSGLDGLVGMSVALSHEVSKFNQSNELLIKAISMAEKATQLYPGEAKTWNALGFAQDVRGDIDSALFSYQKALEINPQRSATLGAIAYLNGIKGELIQSLKINVQLLDSGLEYSNLQVAENLHLLGFVELADQWYQRADVLSPDSVFASNQRVRFLISNQRYQAAQLLLDQVKAKGINRPETYTLQGILQLIRGDKTLALGSFEQALTINNEDFEAQVWVMILSDQIEHKAEKLEVMWIQKKYYWPSDEIIKMIFYAQLGARDKVIGGLKDAFEHGYMDSQWLLQMPPIKPYLSDSAFLFWIDQIQQKANNQRQSLLTVSWLPDGFLDPVTSTH